jgi:tetrahydromethanopterin S-methyltransferase subunit A
MDDKAASPGLKARAIETTRQFYRRGLKLWRKTVGRVVDWPPAPGHFVLGNLESAVAVCTLSSTALIDQISPEYSAIIGRIYTPNLGVEKMIRNVVSNPRLRYLVLCGKDSPVFKVSEALLMLKAHSLDEQGHIIGAAGSLAELTNLPRQTVETFRQQVELVDYTGELNPNRLNQAVRELFERRTPAYQSPAETQLPPVPYPGGETPLELQAQRRTWLELDPLGYFVVNLDRAKNEIVLERYTTEMKLTHLIRGRAADVVYLTAIREKLLSQYEHAAYLGAELAKAETALYNKIPYEQDKKLRLPHRV